MSRRRSLLALLILAACGSRECRLDPSPSCSYRPERGVSDGGADTFADEIVTVRAGDAHACALLSTGEDVFGGEETRVRCWGDNAHAQLARRASPGPGELWWYGGWDDRGVFDVGAAHACNVDPFDPLDLDGDGEDDLEAAEIGCWGNNEGGQLGVGPDEVIEGIVETRPDPERALTGLALGGLHACFGDDDGVSCFGDERWGQLGVTDADCCEPIRLDDALWGTRFTRALVAAGARHSCALLLGDGSDPGPIFCWGDDTHGQLGHGALGQTRLPPTRLGITGRAIAAGPHHTCALHAGGAVSFWGRNARGELGSGDTADRVEPEVVSLPAPAVAVFAGGESGLAFGGALDEVSPAAAHSCALDEEGRAYCWGDNGAGQLGRPAGEPVLTPVATHPAQRFRELALGGRFTCGITTAEELLCWGDNGRGQLGREGESGAEPTGVAIFRESFARP